MIHGRLVARRRLEICKNVNGIAMQNVYCREHICTTQSTHKYKKFFVISPSRFFANEANRKVEKNRQKTGSYGHILTYRAPNFRETFFTHHANGISACADTIVPRSPSRKAFRFRICVLLQIDIPCILLFLIRNENSQDTPKRIHSRFTQTANLRKFGG